MVFPSHIGMIFHVKIVSCGVWIYIFRIYIVLFYRFTQREFCVLLFIPTIFVVRCSGIHYRSAYHSQISSGFGTSGDYHSLWSTISWRLVSIFIDCCLSLASSGQFAKRICAVLLIGGSVRRFFPCGRQAY